MNVVSGEPAVHQLSSSTNDETDYLNRNPAFRDDFAIGVVLHSFGSHEIRKTANPDGSKEKRYSRNEEGVADFRRRETKLVSPDLWKGDVYRVQTSEL